MVDNSRLQIFVPVCAANKWVFTVINNLWGSLVDNIPPGATTSQILPARDDEIKKVWTS